ncbi:acyl-CoA dehydrogenase family protein [Acetivibrio straminisolvens]|uniref:acyl-CoA dehydrogenase family protein n=1 Tax=Acetivibrio straminisolvens TaxID=253314 RepID=UPI001FB12CD0|nr:acyl-CoA dehydrogenase family protein [Acetivibrio straminisolvens]
MKTAAKKDGEHYILNGTKAMITDASIGDYALVFAKTDDNPVGSMDIVSLLLNSRTTLE